MGRVLVVTLYYPPHAWGGYERACADVVERLRRRGHDIEVLTSDARRPGVEDDPAEHGVRRELQAYFRDDDLWQPGPLGRWRVERHNQAALLRALEEHRPDVVSVWHLGALSLGLTQTLAERGVPVVYSICDDWLSYGLALDPWTRLWRHRPRLARVARALGGVPTGPADVGATGGVCFISEDTRRRAEQHSPWTFPRSSVVHCGIDLDRFPRDPAGGTAPWRGHLLYVGRYDRRKGIETPIRALVSLPGVTLEVQATGDPGERARLEGVAAELGVAERVDFADPLPQAALAARYAAADAVVFPSEWEEPFGLVPVEAMAVGTPVVATGMGGSKAFLVDGGNCLLFRAGDPEDLAAAVLRLASDPELRRELVAGGDATARFFDAEHLADALQAWHEWAASGFAGEQPPDRPFDLEHELARG
jgi:glycosyltransferase involved in cell wall biosynthesis